MKSTGNPEKEKDGIPSKRLFGRRKGRPLRTGQANLMETLLPQVVIDLSSGRVEPFALFPSAVRAVRLEIGFGGGEHLAAQAARETDVGFLGCEPFVNGVAKMLSQIEAQKLSNVRLYADDARHLLDALPDGSLDMCFVLFADPWPKKRHAERRFIGRENLDRLSRVLRKDGQLRLATDVVDLAQWMREQTNAHPSFVCVYDGPQAPADWVPTRYEQKGKAAGREPEYLIYKRR